MFVSSIISFNTYDAISKPNNVERDDSLELFKHSTTIGVIGLGFVGLPLSIKLVEKGFKVIGIDIDTKKIHNLINGISHIPDVSDDQLFAAVNSQCFKPSDDYQYIKEMDTIIICVPTPLSSFRTPDLSCVTEATNNISSFLCKNQMVILESSTYPGTTREVILPILEKSGLKVGEDFSLAYSPERIDPGNENFSIDEIPKIVSGITSICCSRISNLYKNIYKNVITVSSTETAEITKLLENTYRFINISFINEFAQICDNLGINVWEVIDAASTKPYGFTPFYPGPGIGGHCIPIDPLYLQWKISHYEMTSSFIKVADTINQSMPQYIIERLNKILPPQKPLNKAKILLYGMTYKKDVGDIRDSKSIDLFRELVKLGTDVYYHDPYVPSIKINEKNYYSSPLKPLTLEKMDCVLLLTDHTSIPLNMILDYSSRVFDAKNIVKSDRGKAIIFRLGGGV
jgi:UDP-N-acetyl-D-glucosamine dehydrogenase